jgi:ABC-2 type transport system permease protein
VVGYIMYLFLYAALGSTVSKVEDVNNATGFIQFIFIGGYLAASFAMNMPSSGVAVVTSMIPFTSLMVMPLRSAIVTVPFWQHLVSGSLLLLTTVFLAV